MPVMDGRRRRNTFAMKSGRKVLIAALNASVFSKERAAMVAAGVDDFLRKAFRPGEVFECLAQRLGVRYVYEKTATAAAHLAATALSPEALRALTEELRREPADARVSLDFARVKAAIFRAGELNGQVGEALAHRAARRAFTPILNTLEASEASLRQEAT